MKKKVLSILLAVCLLAGILSLSASAASLPFKDVPSNAWYRDDLTYSYENGIISGTSATAFSPNGKVTRGMFVTFLGRATVALDFFGSSSHDFSDVSWGSYCSRYVQWASNTGIVSGYSNTRFGPNDPVTREQMAVILANFLQAEGIDLPDTDKMAASFTDMGSVSSWAKSGVETMRRTGLLNGYSDGTFRPKDTVKRAEASAIFARIHKILDETIDVYNYVFCSPDTGEEILTMSLPGSWKGKYIAAIGPGYFSFYSRSNYETNCGGHVFTVMLETNKDWENIPQTELIDTVDVYGTKYDVVRRLPTDIQYDMDNASRSKEYLSMLDDVNSIIAGITFNDLSD